MKKLKKTALLLIIFAGFLLLWRCLPLNLFDSSFSRVILDREGRLVSASLAADEQWRFPPADLVPEKFEKAVIFYEDRRFFSHPGVDPLAVIRAAYLNLTSGRRVSGASTISMQVIRLSRKGKPRILREKLVEVILALRMEMSMSKEEILSLFASHAPFGGNVVGIEAASWRYFGCSPDKLSWAETAMLAVLPNSPSLIHPGRNREKLLEKRNALLDRLKNENVIDSLTCGLAKQEPIPPRPHPIPDFAPHLGNRIMRRAGYSGDHGFRVYTTLDRDIQTRSVEIINRHHQILSSNGIHNAAALIMEVETGNVVAYVGNIHNLRDREHGNFVDIITSPRSTGSILKPLLYAAMIQEGELLPSELVPDIPTRIGGFSPGNYERDYQGAVPAYMALARSLNIPAVRMLRSYGVDRFYLLLKKLGMTTLHRPADQYGLTLILGGAEGTLWDITTIYAGMARSLNSFFRDAPDRADAFFRPEFLLNVENNSPHFKYAASAVKEEGAEFPLDPPSCWLAFEAMMEVVRPGAESAWRNFHSSRKIAWKTGTSYGLRDGWAVGVSPEYAVGVWVGNANGEGRPGLTGISAAAPILFELFGLLDDSAWFSRPENRLMEVDVCGKSGHRAGPRCEETKKELIPFAGLESEPCPFCKTIHFDRELEWRVNSGCERVADIRAVNRFVLPPVQEWYYRRMHSDYHALPPFREDCIDSNRTPSMSLMHPAGSGQIYIPIELDGRVGRTVFEAAHRDAGATVFWHLNEEYIGATSDMHQMELAPDPGEHTLTLVDNHGEFLTRNFTVIPRHQ